LSRKFKQLKPNIKVIGITGFSGSSLVNEARDIDVLLKKPFDGALLLTTIQQVLDREKDNT
jgi:DNA-binding NtrC family response regulator